MNELYFESVVLATIDRCKRNNLPVGHIQLVETAMLGNKTIIRAISRLEDKKKLRVIRPGDGLAHDYEILTPPSELDKMTLNIHLQGKSALRAMENGQ